MKAKVAGRQSENMCESRRSCNWCRWGACASVCIWRALRPRTPQAKVFLFKTFSVRPSQRTTSSRHPQPTRQHARGGPSKSTPTCAVKPGRPHSSTEAPKADRKVGPISGHQSTTPEEGMHSEMPALLVVVLCPEVGLNSATAVTLLCQLHLPLHSRLLERGLMCARRWQTNRVLSGWLPRPWRGLRAPRRIPRDSRAPCVAECTAVDRGKAST